MVGEQGLKITEGILEETDIIPNILGGRIDLVRNPSGELANGFKLLPARQLAFELPAPGDVLSHQEKVQIFVLAGGDYRDADTEIAPGPISVLEGDVIKAHSLASLLAGGQSLQERDLMPGNAAGGQGLPDDFSGRTAEQFLRGRVPPDDRTTRVQTNQQRGNRFEKLGHTLVGYVERLFSVVPLRDVTRHNQGGELSPVGDDTGFHFRGDPLACAGHEVYCVLLRHRLAV